MSFIPHIVGGGIKVGSLGLASGIGNKIEHAFDPRYPGAIPTPPGQNDANNAALAQQDQLRMRRGMMANIFAGNTSQQPVSGKTQLGT